MNATNFTKLKSSETIVQLKEDSEIFVYKESQVNEEFVITATDAESNERTEFENIVLQFKTCTFKKKFTIQNGSKIPYKLSFIDCTFDMGYEAEDVTFYNEVVFGPVSNEGMVTATSNIKFLGKVSFDRTEFQQEVSFQKCSFNEVSFYKTTFKDYVSFWYSEFKANTIFLNTEFEGTAILADVRFRENVLFTYTLIKGICSFRGTHFFSGMDFSLAYIEGEIVLFGIEHEDWARFGTLEDYLKIKENKENFIGEKFGDKKDTYLALKFYKLVKVPDIYQHAVRVKGYIPLENKIETLRIITKVVKENDYIEPSIKLKIQEKNALLLSFKNDLNHPDNLKRPYLGEHFENNKKVIRIRLADFGNFLLLGLGKLSSNYGTSYAKAIVFTFLVAGLFLIVALYFTSLTISFDMEGVGNFVEYYTKALQPYRKIEYIDTAAIKVKAGFYICDFLGRICVSYGIYQTIVAFRKYK